jgi:branched-chain amino acid transport system permease protein
MVTLIVITTLTLGAVYSLIGVGFVVMFRATGVLSFAQGAFFLLASLIFYSLTNAGLGLWAGLVVATILVGLAGALCYLTVFRPAGYDLLFVSMATVGLGTAIESAIALGWGSNLFEPKNLLPTAPHRLFGGIRITDPEIVTVIMAIVLIGALFALIYRTPVGLRMRAVANDSSLASYSGVRVSRISALAWGISAAAAGAAGVGYTLGTVIDPSTLPSLGIVVFPAIIIGGLDSLAGVAVGSILLALAQTLVSVYVGSDWTDIVAYGLLLVLLWIRPTGLFGSKNLVRV